MSLAAADYFNFVEESETFESFGLWNGGSVTVTGISTPELLQSFHVVFMFSAGCAGVLIGNRLRAGLHGMAFDQRRCICRDYARE
jgi:hypothetical protein